VFVFFFFVGIPGIGLKPNPDLVPNDDGVPLILNKAALAVGVYLLGCLGILNCLPPNEKPAPQFGTPDLNVELDENMFEILDEDEAELMESEIELIELLLDDVLDDSVNDETKELEITEDEDDDVDDDILEEPELTTEGTLETKEPELVTGDELIIGLTTDVINGTDVI